MAANETPRDKDKPAGLSSLLSRFASNRTRSQTLTSPTDVSSTLPRSRTISQPHPDSARARLQSILNSAKHHQAQSSGSSKSSTTDLARSVSGPPTYSDTSVAGNASDDVSGPYDPTSPAVYLALLESSSKPAQKQQYLRALADSIKVFDTVDALSIWFGAARFLLPKENINVRMACLRLLRACVHSYDTAITSTQKLVFYTAVCEYQVELKDCTDEEIGSLTACLEAISRGGRDVSGLDGLVERTCEQAGEMFRRRQARRDAIKEKFFKAHPEASLAPDSLAIWTIPPLQDPMFAAVFVTYPTSRQLAERNSAASSIMLLTNIHKFSWPHLSAPAIGFATDYLVAEALATSNDRVVMLILEHIDIISRYGFVPPEQIEAVIYFVARVVSLDGRGRTLRLTDDDDNEVEPYLTPLDPDIIVKAKLVIRNLLRSSANQALKQLRSGLAPPDPAGADDVRDIQVVVGCLRCLRVGLLEVRASPAFQIVDGLPSDLNSAYLDSWPILLGIGLPILFCNLRDALEWPFPEIVEEVLLILQDRLDFRPRAGFKLQYTSSRKDIPPVDEDSAQMTYDDWDMVLDLLNRALAHIRRFEEEARRLWVLDLVSSAQTGPEDDATVPPCFVIFRDILRNLFRFYLSNTYNGPLDRLFALLSTLESSLDDESCVMLLEAYQREHICLPTNVGWLDDLSQIVEAFLVFPLSKDDMAGEMTSLALTEEHRVNRPSATLRSLLLLYDCYDFVKDFNQHRDRFLRRIILPVVQHLLTRPVAAPALASLFQLVDQVLADCVTNYAILSNHTTPDENNVDELILTSVQSALIACAVRPMKAPEGSNLNGHRMSMVAHDMLVLASQEAIQALLKLFIRALQENSRPAASYAKSLFKVLFELCATKSIDHINRQIRFSILQLLLRLRADAKHRITILRSVDISDLAWTLSRMADAHERSSNRQRPVARDVQTPERKRGRRTQESPDRVDGRRSRSGSRMRQSASRERNDEVTDVKPPLWTLPEEPPLSLSDITYASRHLASFDHTVEWAEEEALEMDESNAFPSYSAALDARPASAPALLTISEYLSMLINFLENETEWDLMAYVLCHLPLQLSNKHLFAGPRASRQILRLLSLLCKGLKKGDFASHVALPVRCKREELQRLAYQTLATLIAYKSLFSTAQQHEIVETFSNGLIRSEIAKPCIHALAMCCHELQPSMTRHLSYVLANLLKIMSSSNMPVHILELLASIGQLKQLFSSFRTEDYQTVFGISLQYISLHNDRQVAPVVPPDVDGANSQSDLTYAFSQYVFHLAYYVIDLWYMSLRISQRRQQVSFIVRKLVQANELRGELDEPSEVCLDMVARYAFSNLDARPRKSYLQDLIEKKQKNGSSSAPSKAKTWVRGHALISVRPLDDSRWAELMVRRPSGSVQMLIELENDVSGSNLAGDAEDLASLLKRHREAVLATLPEQDDPQILAVKDLYSRFGIQLSEPETDRVEPKESQDSTSKALNVEPSFFAVQLSSFPEFGQLGPPMLVPDEERYNRSIRNLDTVPVVDFHKIAVLYVGPDDCSEIDILANTHGSRDYMQYLSGLGKLIKLQGNPQNHYLGGLDKEMDTDGAWAYVWENNVTQIVYHVSTLMPTILADDPQCTKKKRHIGNDFVKIIFNDSGRPFERDAIPGQFNFVNIVIEPQTPAGKSWSARGMSSNATFFKVSMQRMDGLPEIGPLGIFKMVSAASLSQFTRHLALHANVFAQVFLESVGVPGSSQPSSRSEFLSNWRRRLQAIKTLRGRLMPEEAAAAAAPKKSFGVDEVLSSIDFSKWA